MQRRAASDAPTLAELGVSKCESSAAQKLSDMPKEEFEGGAGWREDVHPGVSNNNHRACERRP